jgi:hypothetical protein
MYQSEKEICFNFVSAIHRIGEQIKSVTQNTHKMKKMKLLLLALISPVMMWAQEGVNYQAVVRDGSGSIIANSAVAANFKIRQGNAAGTIVYEETHAPNTNAYGLINVVIGEGTPVTGIFADVDWANGPYFLDITLDGNNLGAVEFKSVPYAYHAQSMTNIEANDADGDVHVTSDDNFAVVSIHPTANTGNDSTQIFMGEGSNTQNGMTITYDGLANEMRFAGKTAAYPYMGPFLTIERDSGKSTFSNGVEVVENTTDPAPRTTYGNSGPLAYGYFSGTVIATDYGIASVTNPSTGVYEVILDNAWNGTPVVMATSLNNSADTEICTYNTTGNNTIIVRIVDENNAAVASNFSLIVFGTAL